VSSEDDVTVVLVGDGFRRGPRRAAPLPAQL